MRNTKKTSKYFKPFFNPRIHEIFKKKIEYEYKPKKKIIHDNYYKRLKETISIRKQNNSVLSKDDDFIISKKLDENVSINLNESFFGSQHYSLTSFFSKTEMKNNVELSSAESNLITNKFYPKYTSTPLQFDNNKAGNKCKKNINYSTNIETGFQDFHKNGTNQSKSNSFKSYLKDREKSHFECSPGKLNDYTKDFMLPCTNMYQSLNLKNLPNTMNFDKSSNFEILEKEIFNNNKLENMFNYENDSTLYKITFVENSESNSFNIPDYNTFFDISHPFFETGNIYSENLFHSANNISRESSTLHSKTKQFDFKLPDFNTFQPPVNKKHKENGKNDYLPQFILSNNLEMLGENPNSKDNSFFEFRNLSNNFLIQNSSQSKDVGISTSCFSHKTYKTLSQKIAFKDKSVESSDKHLLKTSSINTCQCDTCQHIQNNEVKVHDWLHLNNAILQNEPSIKVTNDSKSQNLSSKIQSVQHYQKSGMKNNENAITFQEQEKQFLKSLMNNKSSKQFFIFYN